MRACDSAGNLEDDDRRLEDALRDVANQRFLQQASTMRVFPSGATRDEDSDKIDFEGFLSPSVLMRYGLYMHANRIQADGKLRTSDNWQSGIPKDQYLKSLLRHVIDLWFCHRGGLAGKRLEDALCAILFNCQGYLYEVLHGR